MNAIECSVGLQLSRPRANFAAFARTAAFAEMCRQVHIANLKLISKGSVANRRNQPFL